MTPKTNTRDADQQITNWFENISVMLSLENHPGPNTFLTRRQVDASAIEPVDKWMQPCVDAPTRILEFNVEFARPKPAALREHWARRSSLRSSGGGKLRIRRP